MADNTIDKESIENQSKLPVRFEVYKNPAVKGYITTTFYHLPTSEIKFLHRHSAFEIGRCISGSGHCYVDNRIIPFKENAVQIILPNQPHYNIADHNSPNTSWYFTSFEPLKMTSDNLHTNAHQIIELLEKITLTGVFPPEKHPKITRYVNDIIDETLSSGKYMSERTNALIYLLLTELASVSDNNFKTTSIETDEYVKLVFPAITLVSHCIRHNKPVTVSAMAQECNISESYFRKIFTRIIGESPKKYIDRCQLVRISQLLLKTDMPVFWIISDMGIAEPSTFFRKFAKAYGVSPLNYRKQHQQSEDDN